ncbi:MAG: dihydropteroate synthase [Nitrospirae bacterium]|nr:dihydropteroate synthase [Nitrospirota bacterium]
MGIINVTPDSFSDGGKFHTLKNAIKRAKELEKQGANILDIGGESTGPGSKNVSLEEELKRVIPVIKELRKSTKLPISIDTYKAEVAQQALGAGANMVNDITALRGDPKMASVIKKHKCQVILMYSKDPTPRTTIKKKKYKDVIKTIKDFLKKRIQYAKKQGISNNQIIIDPGMGHFISALPQYSYEIIARLHEFHTLGYQILIGASRKSFLGGSMESRVEKEAVVSAIAYNGGVSIIRTHDVKQIKWLKSLS